MAPKLTGEPDGEVPVLLVRGTETHRYTLRWWRGDHYRIRIDGPTGPLETTGPDLFDALVALRRHLEPAGWRLGVQGARSDTYPSGMARDMAGGEQVYVMRMGAPAGTDDLVDTLGPVHDHSLLGTVDEQERYFRRWLDS